MPNQTSTAPRTDRRPSGERSPSRRVGPWLAVVLPILFVTLLVILAGGDEPTGTTSSTATDFQLPTTAGDTASFVADTPGRTLLFFSMGLGCDICFTQIPEITPGLDQRGIRLLSVMVNPLDMVAAEAGRWGIDTPILIDEDRSVSEAYGMLGLYGHGNLPTHSFALVEDGEITWVKHYPDRFVPAEELFAEIDNA